MIIRAITVFVKPEYISEFEIITHENHVGSIKEPGVLRFDVLKDLDSPGEYLLYEVYRDEAATLAHKETDHYKKWKSTVAPMMSQDRVGKKFAAIAPTDEKAW